MLNNNQGSKNMSERLEDLRDQKETNDLLKKYCDVQSSRIDLIEKRLRRLEAKEDTQTKKASGVVGVDFRKSLDIS